MSAADLRRTAAALDNATTAYEAIRDRAADHKAALYTASERNAAARDNDARRRVAVALGDPFTEVGAEVEEVVDQTVNEAVTAEFKRRSDHALAAMNAAQSAYNDAARAYLVQEAVGPAAQRFVAAMNSVGDAAAELMGAHFAAYERFAKEGRYRGPGMDHYGPAAELLRHLNREFTWTETPYAIRPEWLPKHGPMIEPSNLDGVAEAEHAALAMVEGAAR